MNTSPELIRPVPALDSLGRHIGDVSKYASEHAHTGALPFTERLNPDFLEAAGSLVVAANPDAPSVSLFVERWQGVWEASEGVIGGIRADQLAELALIPHYRASMTVTGIATKTTETSMSSLCIPKISIDTQVVGEGNERRVTDVRLTIGMIGAYSALDGATYSFTLSERSIEALENGIPKDDPEAEAAQQKILVFQTLAQVAFSAEDPVQSHGPRELERLKADPELWAKLQWKAYGSSEEALHVAVYPMDTKRFGPNKCLYFVRKGLDDGTVIVFANSEFDAFVDGAKDGEFDF